jgi:hypothetical protein
LFIQVTWDGTDEPIRHTVSELGADVLPLPLLVLAAELQPAAARMAVAAATARAVLLGRTAGPPSGTRRGACAGIGYGTEVGGRVCPVRSGLLLLAVADRAGRDPYAGVDADAVKLIGNFPIR